ncbi:unnamed protein product [Peronospora belbahrii]|uniref:Uncharacterized protein n=1 Tax=Peronospora belbahrii TaxID=622444 RepID=A0ABN8CWI0_9STRA|nr:unnamed protein product [Peronospora belbahrii]
MDTSPPPIDAGALPTSCITRTYSPSPTRYSSLQSVNVFHAPLRVELSLQSRDVPYQRPEAIGTKEQQQLQQLPLLIEERLQDLLGEPLTVADLASVQLMPMRPCLPREIVAVKDSDGILRYGKVKDEEDISSSREVKVQVSKSCIRWYTLSQIYFFQPIQERTNSKEVRMWTSDKEEETEASIVGVVAKVNALLARMNVSLGMSYKELLDEVWRLQHRVTVAEEDRRGALQQIEQALRAQRDAEKALLLRDVCQASSW